MPMTVPILTPCPCPCHVGTQDSSVTMGRWSEKTAWPTSAVQPRPQCPRPTPPAPSPLPLAGPAAAVGGGARGGIFPSPSPCRHRPGSR